MLSIPDNYLATMDPLIDNLFSDIFENVLNRFFSNYNFDLPPPLDKTSSQSQQQLLVELSSMLLLPEAIYKSAIDTGKAIQSWQPSTNMLLQSTGQ
jgi:hypothetical protein